MRYKVEWQQIIYCWKTVEADCERDALAQVIEGNLMPDDCEQTTPRTKFTASETYVD